MSTITVPATIDEAVANLNGIGASLTAKDWERAAIVYAFTEPTEKPGPKSSVTSDRSSFAEFAKLGIAGLQSKNTVQRYHELWVAHGDTAIQAGAVADLPDIPFPTQPRNKGTRVTAASVKESVAKDIPVVKAASRLVPQIEV